MTSLGILFTLICIVQLLLIILWRKPKKLLKSHQLTKSKKRQVTILFLTVMLILYGLFFIKLFQYHQPQPLAQTQYTHDTVYPTPAATVAQPLWGRKTGMISNLYFLYLSTDKSKEGVTRTAYGLRQQYCKNLCIINLYDDKTAFEKDIQRINITSEEKMKEWNKKNYVFVADHYLGYLDAVQDASFNYYPFHDSYYKHAKEGTLDNY